MKDHGNNAVPRGPDGQYRPVKGHAAKGADGVSLNVRCTREQRARWRAMADALGITLTELVVRRMEER